MAGKSALLAVTLVVIMTPEILGWNRAKKSEFPFIGFLLAEKQDPTRTRYCLVTLISLRHVIVAKDKILKLLKENYGWHVVMGVTEWSFPEGENTADGNFQKRAITSIHQMGVYPSYAMEYMEVKTYVLVIEVDSPFQFRKGSVETGPILEHLDLWPKKYREPCKSVKFRRERSSITTYLVWREIKPMSISECPIEQLRGCNLCLSSKTCDLFHDYYTVFCQNALTAFYGWRLTDFEEECVNNGSRTNYFSLLTPSEYASWIWFSVCPEAMYFSYFPGPPNRAPLPIQAAKAPLLIVILVFAACMG